MHPSGLGSLFHFVGAANAKLRNPEPFFLYPVEANYNCMLQTAQQAKSMRAFTSSKAFYDGVLVDQSLKLVTRRHITPSQIFI